MIEVLEAVHDVNADNPTPVFPFASWATAATNLQDAINAGRVIGYGVVVTNGVDHAGTVALTHAVLRSVNGPEVTILDGGGAAGASIWAPTRSSAVSRCRTATPVPMLVAAC